MQHSSLDYIADAAANTQQALERMEVRSSRMAQQMVKAGLPAPATRRDIELYVQSLLAGDAAK